MGEGRKFNFNLYTRCSQFSALHTYAVALQVAITTPEGGSWGYPYSKIFPYK